MNIHPSAFIAPNATLTGNISIGADSSIWFGTVIRADRDTVTIGEGTNIQDNSVVHEDPGCPVHLGNHVVVGHRAIIHGCSIGDNSLIGMGAIVMNRARIGRYCIIGAGAVVTEGMEIPDYSLVLGAPAKIIKKVTEAQMEGIRQGAQSYIEMARRYRSGEFDRK